MGHSHVILSDRMDRGGRDFHLTLWKNVLYTRFRPANEKVQDLKYLYIDKLYNGVIEIYITPCWLNKYGMEYVKIKWERLYSTTSFKLKELDNSQYGRTLILSEYENNGDFVVIHYKMRKG